MSHTGNDSYYYLLLGNRKLITNVKLENFAALHFSVLYEIKNKIVSKTFSDTGFYLKSLNSFRPLRQRLADCDVSATFDK